MNPNAEFDIIVYGASGYTGRLVAEHLVSRNAAGARIRCALAGRSAAKLAAVRNEIGAPQDTPIIAADSNDVASIRSMASRTKAVVTTVGPYSLYGSVIVAECVAAGTDYLDLAGEVTWMRRMIEAHQEQAKVTGARILFSCGFDSLPSEIGVWLCQKSAIKSFGEPVSIVKGRVRSFNGSASGGSLATGKAMMASLQEDTAQMALMQDPFCLTPGFQGVPQPLGLEPYDDPDVGQVGPFMVAMIDTKNVHRSNFLLGHLYGRDFVYDEMMVGAVQLANSIEAAWADTPPYKPGEGPTKEEREAGSFDVLFIGIAKDGRQVRVSVKADLDPGYGSTSKMIAETAICLIGALDVAGGIWTPAAALQGRLVEQLRQHAGLKFSEEI